MIQAEVIGSVVCDRKTDWYVDPVFLIVQEITSEGKKVGKPLIALDPVGARGGERVLVSQGSSVRQTEATRDRPVDALIAGIIDQVALGDRLVYNEGQASGPGKTFFE
ncbi:MAG: EutN/CcmL family microcompartment protein [Spirochaetales bacterium]|nr:EutN/CcmL family microcompartment protein [Spirochaetales bacterium]